MCHLHYSSIPWIEMSVQQLCGHCQKPEASKMCGRCLNVYYCDKTCQSLAFFDHWSWCSNLNSKVRDRDVLAFRAWFKYNEENFRASGPCAGPKTNELRNLRIFWIFIKSYFSLFFMVLRVFRPRDHFFWIEGVKLFFRNQFSSKSDNFSIFWL